MKNLFLTFLSFLCLAVYSQEFTISQMTNPDPNDKNLYSVLLLDNQAWAGGGDIGLYYENDSWSQNSSQSIGAFSGTKKDGGGVYVVASRSGGLHYWNNASKNWQLKASWPDTDYSYSKIFAYSEDNIYLCGTHQLVEYGKIWHYDGSIFQELRHDHMYRYRNLWVKNENDILVFTNKNSMYPPKMHRLINGDSLVELYSFPDDRGDSYGVWSKDNETFFILSQYGDLYRWDDVNETMDEIRSYVNPDLGSALVVIDNNNVIISGLGIAHINVETGHENILYQLGPGSMVQASSYDNGRAIFVGNGGNILEMLVVNSVSEKEIEASFKLYPNPVSDILNVELPVFGIEKKEIEIFNSMGQKVSSSFFSSFHSEIDVSGLSPGIYIISLSDGTRVFKKKFIKK